MPRPRFTPQSAAEWAAVLPRWVGAAGLLATFVFYVVTGKLESTWTTTFGGLLLGSEGLELLKDRRTQPAPRRKAPTKRTKKEQDPS